MCECGFENLGLKTQGKNSVNLLSFRLLIGVVIYQFGVLRIMLRSSKIVNFEYLPPRDNEKSKFRF